MRVHPNAVVDGQPGGRRQSGVRQDAGTDDHRIGGDQAAVAQSHTMGLSVVPGDLGDLDAAPHIDTVVAVQRGEDPGDLRAEDSEQGECRGFQHGDLQAGGAGGRCGLQADPAGADHRDPGRPAEHRPDPVAVLQRAQVVNAGEIGSGYRQWPR